MQRPDFWESKNWKSRALSPFAWLFQRMSHRRITRPSEFRADCPVICVGNITVGGSGKTPVVLALAEIFIKWGIETHILSRGYGGSLSTKKVTKVDPLRHHAREVGDEPLLLSQKLRGKVPVWIGRDRRHSSKAACATGAKCLVMDDGFQNPALHKDFAMLVFDDGYGIGNGACLPAGPLRESLSHALDRCDALIVIKRAKTKNQSLLKNLRILSRGKPIFTAKLQANVELPPQDLDYFAFAGIGQPQKFFEDLQTHGYSIRKRRSFPDHHPYSAGDIRQLCDQALREDLRLITTEKDLIKIPARWHDQISCLPVSLLWDDPEEIEKQLKGLFHGR